MSEIAAALVKELRETTGAGMMDCKKALTETDGDLEGAVDWLRKKGLAAAGKKAGRVAAEGLVGALTENGRGAVIEVNAETDFVARDVTFQDFVRTCAGLALEAGGDVEKLLAAAYPDTGDTVADRLTDLIAKIGENTVLRRSARLAVSRGVVASYVHSQVAPGLGKIGVLVALESTGEVARLAALGKQLAMHVAAAAPLAVATDDVDPAALQRERAILTEQARASGKPDNIIDKMVEGRLRKFYEAACLLEQVFVIDGETKVRRVLEQASEELGARVTVAGFVRFQLGEGVERQEADFAAEVAAQLGRS
ncbi:MAG: translation elongation factor Ts [Kiloniellaceae bacterium]